MSRSLPANYDIAARLAFEAGYKACEQGDNFDMALAKAAPFDRTTGWNSIETVLPTKRDTYLWTTSCGNVVAAFFYPEDEAERPGKLKRLGYTHWMAFPEAAT